MQASPPATRQETVRFAFNSSLPIFFGYVILGTGYGLYMHNLGFGFWFPTIMAAVVYGGSVNLSWLPCWFRVFCRATLS